MRHANTSFFKIFIMAKRKKNIVIHDKSKLPPQITANYYRRQFCSNHKKGDAYFFIKY